MSEKIESHLQPHRTVVSFWPFLMWMLPFIVVYSLGHFGLEHLCGRGVNEKIALPLVLVSVVGYGMLAWRRHNEFSLVMFVLVSAFSAESGILREPARGSMLLRLLLESGLYTAAKQLGP